MGVAPSQWRGGNIALDGQHWGGRKGPPLWQAIKPLLRSGNFSGNLDTPASGQDEGGGTLVVACVNGISWGEVYIELAF